MKGKDLNYKGDVERKTNFMDQLEEGRENSVVFYNITGLDACTSYDLQLIVVPIGFNTNDTDSYYYRDSLEQENTGPDETLPPKQLSCSISEQNEDIWIFSWQDPMNECPTSKFNVAWTAQSRWSSAVASMSYVTIEHQEQFIDFLAYADYHFAVSADYGDVTSANGSIVCTSPEKAPSAPQNVRATGHDQTSLLVEWDAPVAANGIIKSYVVFMNNSKESISVDVISQDTFYEATGLESCLNYSIEVVAVNGAGYGPPSDMITHLYESGGTSNLEFIVCHVNSSGVYTQWNPIYRDCKESSYEVWYSLYIPWKNETRSDETTVNVNHYDLPATDFYPGTEYNIIVATADFSLESGCAVNSSDTKSSPPSITELSATVSSVYVKWSPPEEANGLIQSYIISLTGDNGQSLHEFVDGSTTQVNVAEKILSGTSYEVEVAAINGFGEGEYSAPKTVTTLPSRS
ncbi:putative metal responsive protein [Hyalella azteca]|nr:putative metal responsive protein [Hyalella azteca]